MVKRMFSTNTGSKPNTGGICSECRQNTGVTVYIDEFKSLCVSCNKSPGICFLVSKKGAIKLVMGLDKKHVLPHSEKMNYRIKHFVYGISDDTRGYRVWC